MNRGLLIAFEGADKAGKSTQVDELAKRFIMDGEDVVLIHFPAYDTPSGQAIRAILDGIHPLTIESNPYEVQALYAINRYEQQMRIEHALMSGKVVICDRYIYSGVVYGAQNDVDIEWNLSIQHSLVQPDITVLLDMSLQEYLDRTKGEDLDAYERNLVSMNGVLGLYGEFGRENDWIILYGTGTVDEVAEIIYKRVVEKVTEMGAME